MATNLKIGDYVRQRDSTFRGLGMVAFIRDADYVIVQWDDRYRTTHRWDSLEIVAEPARGPAVREPARSDAGLIVTSRF